MNIFPPCKILQRQIYIPSKGPQITIIMPSKINIIIEPLKHVHQTPLFKLNKFSKPL
jgi:hypothetical protein